MVNLWNIILYYGIIIDQRSEGDGHMGPLTGYKVVEIAHWLVAPYCTNMLSDLGAEVIKIEPITGDQVRNSGNHFKDGESYLFAAYNHGKKSIALNLKNEEGLKIARELCREADIIVENYRPGTCDRLGIGYETVAKENKKVIYCSISAFGETEGYMNRPGMDPIIQGMGAAMSLTGQTGDGQQPMLVGIPVADVSTAYLAFGAICAALVDRERSGNGQHVKLNLIDSMVFNLSTRFGQFIATGQSPKPLGNQHAEVVPYQAFPTANGWIMAGAQSEAAWKGFCEAINYDELIHHEHYCNNSLRLQNRESLTKLLNERLQQKTTEQWEEIFLKQGVLHGPIWDVKQLLESKLVADHGLITEVEHEIFKRLPVLRTPISFSEREVKVKSGPPLLGENTSEILQRLGYSEEQIDKLELSQTVKRYQRGGEEAEYSKADKY